MTKGLQTMHPGMTAGTQGDEPFRVMKAGLPVVHVKRLSGTTRATLLPVPFKDLRAMAPKVSCGIRDLPGAHPAHGKPAFERPPTGTEERPLKAAAPGEPGLDLQRRPSNTKRVGRGSHQDLV
jgi:hypothetical protein